LSPCNISQPSPAGENFSRVNSVAILHGIFDSKQTFLSEAEIYIYIYIYINQSAKQAKETHYDTRQHTATQCNTRQHNAVHTATHTATENSYLLGVHNCNTHDTLRNTVTRYRTLQRTLQHTTTQKNYLLGVHHRGLQLHDLLSTYKLYACKLMYVCISVCVLYVYIHTYTAVVLNCSTC